jgi:hypothetical protein
MAAAAVPMHSLAAPCSGELTKTKDHSGKPPVVASVSGCHSAIGSHVPANTPVSVGHGCSHYTTKTNWHGYDSDPKKDGSCVNKTFRQVFGSGSTDKCYNIVKNKSSSSECRWVLAYVNAEKCYTTGMNYPYCTTEIVDMHRNPSKYGGATTTLASCESFFKDYMETES